MIMAITDDNGLFGRFEKLPTTEAERWHAAFVETDGRRHVKSKQAGLNGVCWMTLNEFCDEVERRISRWFHERYEVCEAAQILADANPGTVAISGISAEGLCEQMEDAIHAGELTVRLNGIAVPASSFTQHRLYLQTVLQSDVNKWLNKTGAGYALAYPYTQPNAKTEVGRGLNNEEVQRREFVAWLNSDNQRSPEEQSQYEAADQQLKRIDELDKAISEAEPIQAINWGQKEDKDRKLAALKSERVALWAEIFPADSINKQTAVVTDSASDGMKLENTPSTKPLQRSAAQDTAILLEIKKQGFDPLGLPKNPDGKPGVKASVRAALSKNLLFAGSTVFDKAWERLTARADIVILR